MSTSSNIARAQLCTALHLLATIVDEAANGIIAWEGTEKGDDYVDMLEHLLASIHSFPARPYKTPEEIAKPLAAA